MNTRFQTAHLTEYENILSVIREFHSIFRDKRLVTIEELEKRSLAMLDLANEFKLTLERITIENI